MPFKFGLGARVGDGKQYMSWIHIDDAVRAILFLLQKSTEDRKVNRYLVNLTSPNPVTNNNFTKALAEQLGRPSFLLIPAWFLQLALGEMARLLLTGQKVMPDKLLELGFEFSFPSLDKALEKLFQ